jgi:hypothetical protein
MRNFKSRPEFRQPIILHLLSNRNSSIHVSELLSAFSIKFKEKADRPYFSLELVDGRKKKDKDNL